MKKSDEQTHRVRCWEFFHCAPQKHEQCLMAQADEWRCWLVDIPCCKMDARTPRPLSVKKVICKMCAYYKIFVANE